MNSKTEFLHFQEMAVLPADAPLHIIPRFSACSHAEMLFCSDSGSRFAMHFTAGRIMPESVISVFEHEQKFSCVYTVTAPEFQDRVSWFIRGELPVSPEFTVYGLCRKPAAARKTFQSGSFTRTFCRLKPSRFRKYVYGGLRL